MTGDKGRWEQHLINGKWRWTCPKCSRYTKTINMELPPYCMWCGEHLKGEKKNAKE